MLGGNQIAVFFAVDSGMDVDITLRTLGIPLFQEQLMQMAIDVAGFTPSESDELRQAMGSKRSAAHG